MFCVSLCLSQLRLCCCELLRRLRWTSWAIRRPLEFQRDTSLVSLLQVSNVVLNIFHVLKHVIIVILQVFLLRFDDLLRRSLGTTSGARKSFLMVDHPWLQVPVSQDLQLVRQMLL